MYNMYIYVLLLKSNKYYVGKTKNIEQRYKSHTSGNGSYWSSIYKPISMIYHYEVPDHHSSLEETLLTFHMMLKCGINNVRGGEYSEPIIYDKSAVRRIRFSIKHHLYLQKTDQICACGDIKIRTDFKCSKCLYIDTQPFLKLREYIKEYRDIDHRNVNFRKIIAYIVFNAGQITQFLPEIQNALLLEIQFLLRILKASILLLAFLANYTHNNLDIYIND
jgi:hypothetical protein